MSYVPPSNPQQYPILFSPGEYGYFPSVLPFEDDDHIDAPQLALGSFPVTPSGSPFTYTNNDNTKNPNKDVLTLFIKGDSNYTAIYQGRPYPSGGSGLFFSLNWGDSVVFTWTGAIPSVIAQVQTNIPTPTRIGV